MSTADRFAIVEEMIALPFSGEGDASGGAGYGLRVLLASRDFWDDRSGETVEAAEEEIDAALRELVAALTARWGEPESVDLEPYLRAESPVPEPIQTLRAQRQDARLAAPGCRAVACARRRPGRSGIPHSVACGGWRGSDSRCR